MTNITPILAQEAGIQYQGVEDRSSKTGAYPIIGMITGAFKRGRYDKPMTITLENIKAQLGHEPDNPHYIAVLDTLLSGVPSVQVVRVKDGDGGDDGGGGGGDGDGGGDGGGGGPEICNCDASWVLIPNLTPDLTINKYDELVFAIKDFVQNTQMAYTANMPIIDLLRENLTYDSFRNRVELIRCDSEGTVLRNLTDDCLNLSIMTIVKDASGNKSYNRYLTGQDLCAYDANEVIPDSNEVSCTPTVIPFLAQEMGVDNLVFEYSVNGGPRYIHQENTLRDASVQTVLVNVLFYSLNIIREYSTNSLSGNRANFLTSYEHPIQGAPSGNGSPMTVEFWATPGVDNCLVTKAFGGDFVLHSCGEIAWTEDKVQYPQDQ
ncbi:hypothetical protein F965_00121 [Acinetobacter schindleri NIPH 900]|uniref:Uncharacterized protein n=1 Tax=Acinetobacter schindleri NIPH 900 TaxID=1217675 RepID=N8Y613_9GAMM|nr:hypothetical protein [Acinetobacter schindleri]ENV14775.1 hypothetical protein F965_00121 [Acinetobacter schindleri NIPH 900]